MIISALGGATVVAGAIIFFTKKKIEEIIEQKIKYHYEAKLENQKGVIEQKLYVSQHKFDKEYEVMQELMEKSYDFVYLSWEAYTNIGLSIEDDSNLRKYTKACDDFTLYYMKNCAFLPKELADPFDLFVRKINEFRSAANGYKDLLIKVLAKDNTEDYEEKMFVDYSSKMRTIHDEINKGSEYSHDKLVDVTREYYKKIDIK